MMTINAYLGLLFDPSECVWVSDKLKGNCLHPAKNANLSRKTENESGRYRNLLIEMDNPNLNSKIQQDIINDLGIPYSTATFIGGKSVHFVISLATAVTWEEYKWFADHLKQIIPEMDPSVATHTRFTRMPFAMRDGVEQTLLTVNSRVDNAELQRFIAAKITPTPPLPLQPKKSSNQKSKCKSHLTANQSRDWIAKIVQWYVTQHLQHSYDGVSAKVTCPACHQAGQDTNGDNLQLDGPDFYFHCFAGHTAGDIVAAINRLRSQG